MTANVIEQLNYDSTTASSKKQNEFYRKQPFIKWRNTIDIPLRPSCLIVVFFDDRFILHLVRVAFNFENI